MRFLRLTLIILLLPVLALAQGVSVTEGNNKMGKKKMWTFSASYRYDKASTAIVMQQNMERAGLTKPKTKRGVKRYKGVVWNSISPNKGDYYYKVKNKKGRTTVYITASKGYDNYVTTENDAQMAGKITNYLRNLEGQIASAIAIQQKETEMQKISERNEELNKELEANKAQEAQKANEIRNMRNTAPLEVK